MDWAIPGNKSNQQPKRGITDVTKKGTSTFGISTEKIH